MTEMTEFEEGDLYEGPPDSLDRGDGDVQEDVNPDVAIRTLMATSQRDTPGTLAWYTREATSPPFDPDGMCLKICRTARNIGSRYASALKAQQATPAKNRITSISAIRPGHVMYFDDPRDGNPYGHIVTVAGRVKGVNPGSLDSLVVWTNSVKRNVLVKVRASYFPRYWGDKFVFASNWLNGVELNMPVVKPPAPPTPQVKTIDVVIRECSMQYNDPFEQKKSDTKKAFEGTPHVILFTEVGRGQNKVGQDLIKAEAKRLGYAVYFDGYEGGIAAKFSGGNVVEHGYLGPLIPGKAGDHPHLGLNWITVEHRTIGNMHFGAIHLLNRDYEPARAKANNVAIKKACDFLEERAFGHDLGFIGGDANRDDRTKDLLPNTNFTTAADELKKWIDTHGNNAIDFIASLDKDVRVKAKSIREISRVYSDHDWLEVVYSIAIPA